MADIAPDLLKKIQEEFLKQTKASEKLERILIKIQQGKATYADAAEYAAEIGNALAHAFAVHLSPDVLPVGKLGSNIAERIIQPLLLEVHTDVAAVAAQVQTALNKAANIGIRAQTTSFPDKLVTDMLNKVTSAPSYKDAAWILDEPIKTLMRKVVDITIKKNFEFQGKSGLRPQIIRHSAKQCCEWCAAISGTYTYPDTPQDVFRRHDRCRCVVEYNPASGKRQNVHTKQWTDSTGHDKIEKRKLLSQTDFTDRNKQRTKNLEYQTFDSGNDVNQSLQKQEARWLAKLTEDERVLVAGYCDTEYEIINSRLRQGIPLGDKGGYVRGIDSAIDKFDLDKNIVTYRAVDGNALQGLQFENCVGKTYRDAGYMSTSPAYADALKDAEQEYLFEIKVPQGQGRGAYVNAISPYKDAEYELLLKRNTECIITGTGELDGKKLIKMEVVANDGS